MGIVGIPHGCVRQRPARARPRRSKPSPRSPRSQNLPWPREIGNVVTMLLLPFKLFTRISPLMWTYPKILSHWSFSLSWTCYATYQRHACYARCRCHRPDLMTVFELAFCFCILHFHSSLLRRSPRSPRRQRHRRRRLFQQFQLFRSLLQ